MPCIQYVQTVDPCIQRILFGGLLAENCDSYYTLSVASQPHNHCHQCCFTILHPQHFCQRSFVLNCLLQLIMDTISNKLICAYNLETSDKALVKRSILRDSLKKLLWEQICRVQGYLQALFIQVSKGHMTQISCSCRFMDSYPSLLR